MASGFQRGDPILRAITWYADLEKSSVRNETGFFIVEGKRAVEQVATTAPDSIDEILVTDEYDSGKLQTVAEIRTITSSQFNKISTAKTPQGILAVVKIPPMSNSETLPKDTGKRILLLEHIQDPGNVGTLIRTAAAFDFSGIILSSMCADPFSPKVVQASAGSLMSLWIRRTPLYLQCVKQLQGHGYPLIATSAKGSESHSFSSKNVLLALGNEGNGLSEELMTRADRLVRIPINDKNVESLNVAVTGGVLMYAIGLQQ